MTTENHTAANDTHTQSLLAELPAKTEIRGIYRVQQMETRRRQDGASFWKLILTDRSGEMTCYAWPERCPIDIEYRPHQLVQVWLATRELNCEVVADVLELIPITTTPIGTAIDLLPATACPIPGVLQRLVSLVDLVSTSCLRRFIDTVLANDSVALPFLVNPASAQYHHAEAGGLLRHSVEVAEHVCARNLSTIDREVALVAALFHDIGKTRTFDRDGSRTHLGEAVDHDALTLEICAIALRELDRECPDAARLLRHIWTASTNAYYGHSSQSGLVSVVRSADRDSAELDKDGIAFADAPPDCRTARVGRETRIRLAPTLQPVAA